MRLTHDYDTPPSNCPHCGKENDGAAGGDRPPEDGDFGVCIYCALLVVYEGGLLRLPTDVETIEAEGDPDFKMAQSAILTLKLSGALDD